MWLVGSSTFKTTEDTFILLDALEADADAIRSLAPRLCLEIGRVPSHLQIALSTSIPRRDVDSFPSASYKHIKIRYRGRLHFSRADKRKDLQFLFVLVLISPHRGVTPSMMIVLFISLSLYRYQSTRSNMYRAYRVPKQGTDSSNLLYFTFLWL